MMTRDENETLMRTGPATPMGELFRRYWQPLLLCDELPGPDCTPIRVRCMSEDLIAFRDSDGRVGIVDAYCPHRSAPLFFGRNEEGGLRCVYHGWKFDVDGNCVDMPNCMEGETFKQKIKLPSYPTIERAGVIWIYMGPKDRQPPFPGYPFIELPLANVYANKFETACNYFQSVEGDLDPSHNAFLHSNLATRKPGRIVPMMWAGENPPQFFDTDYGVQMVTVQTSPEGKLDVGVGHFIMTTATSVRGAGIVRQMNFRTPIDDENSFFFRIRYSQTGALDERELWEAKHGEYLYPPLLPGTFRPQANKSNDYLVDRVQQRFFNFSGIKSFIIQDVAVTDDQRGPMSDRTREHLVSVDEYIIRARKRLVRAARDLENGIEPKGPFMPETMSLLGSRFSVEPGTDLERAVREHIDVQLGRTVTAREAVAAGVLASE
ncbi:MAG TPA: Rieske 2Fe-2S domain-containing protein [Chloroflexota bacterium]|nr:Rieske 2Fe-2S domain-containing protein [Chloroflexota bacterium]